MSKIESETIALVGQSGKMGEMLHREFTLAGYTVLPLNRTRAAHTHQMYDGTEAACVLERSSTVILSVPVTALEQVLHELTPHLQKHQLLMDVTSVKSLPMQWMGHAYAGPIIGTHPLFGPTPKAEDRKVILVRGHHAEESHIAYAQKLFQAIKCRTVWSSAEEHDRGVAFAQSLNFTVSAAFFSILAQHAWVEPYLTPSFKRHLEAARKHLTIDANMFCEFTAYNPQYKAALQAYIQNLERVKQGELHTVAEEAVVWYHTTAHS